MAEQKKRGRKAEPGFTSFKDGDGNKVKIGATLKTDVADWNMENVYVLAKNSAEAKCRLKAKNDYLRISGEIGLNRKFRDGMISAMGCSLKKANEFMVEMGRPVELPTAFSYSEADIMGFDEEEVEEDAE